jgi:hypothetical protein
VSHRVIQIGVVEIIPKSVSRDSSVELSAESSMVSPVINLKFRARRSMEHKLEDSKVVLSVNIIPPKDKITDLSAEYLGASAVRINSVSETQKLVQDRDSRKNVNILCSDGGNTKCKTAEVRSDNENDIFCSASIHKSENEN